MKAKSNAFDRLKTKVKIAQSELSVTQMTVSSAKILAGIDKDGVADRPFAGGVRRFVHQLVSDDHRG